MVIQGKGICHIVCCQLRMFVNVVLKLVNYHMYECFRKVVWQYFVSNY